MQRLLLFLPLLLALLTASAAGKEAELRSYAYAAKVMKEQVRDPKKAAMNKRKELRDQGVRNVHVKAPGDWPSRVPAPADMQLRAMPKDPAVTGCLYESDNYIFRSPVALSEDGQRMIAELFECTYAANKAIGKVLAVPRTEIDRAERKYPVMLVRNKAEYAANGGPEGSSGVYLHAKRYPVVNGMPQMQGPATEEHIAQECVLVPFSSLGLDEQGRLTTRGKDINTHTLVHEITHQNFVLNQLPIALNEGWAEYVGYVPYIGTELDFDRGFSLIVHEAKKFAGAGAMNFPFSIEEFLTMDQQTMYAYMHQGKANTYLLGCMIVAYYVHLDGKRGITAMREYMKATADGTDPQEAVQKLIAPHRNTAQLEKDFLRAWKSKGVKGMGFQHK